jgi:hypothetical protein
MLKILVIPAVLTFAAVAPPSLVACSMAGCPGNGVELRSNFVVRVIHEDKPLPGVSVQITRHGVQVFSGRTEADGAVHISSLPAGDYWLNAELLGISAAYTCFHVNSHATRKARKKLKFEWGDMPYATRQIAGRLQISELGKEGTLVWRVQHRIDAPIRNASLILRSPINEAVYRTASDSDGDFSFAEIPAGIYVLHIEGGAPPSGEVFGSDDFVLRLAASAKSKKLILTPNVGGGSCGGWSITQSL